MAYTKTVWEDLPSTNTPLNATNLNKIENELEVLENRTNKALTKGFSSITSLNVTSSSGYGTVVILSAAFVCIVQLQNTTVTIHDITGTHGNMTASMNNKVLTLSNLYNWDHYIIIGSNAITSIE